MQGALGNSALGALLTCGEELPAETRAEMEARFGQDFSDVRVHVDGEAAETAAAVGADAFTVGRDIVFGAGRYDPRSEDGARLLYHELAHVVQQSRGAAALTREGVAGLEADAGAAAHAVATSDGAVTVSGVSGVGLLRQPTLAQSTDIYSRSREILANVPREAPWHRSEPAPNYPEALARLIEDERISDVIQFQSDRRGARRRLSDAEARISTILWAAENPIVRGLKTGGIVKGWTDAGFRPVFRDPHPSSNNQVGHFLTAVNLGLSPGAVNSRIVPRGGNVPGDIVRGILQGGGRFARLTIREVVGARPDMSDEDVAIRLMIGHEKSADPIVDPTAFRDQFQKATAADVEAFRRAEQALGKGVELDVDAAAKILRESIHIDETQRGNSYADLALSLVGWHLGRQVGNGEIVSRADLAKRIRANLGSEQPYPSSLGALYFQFRRPDK